MTAAPTLGLQCRKFAAPLVALVSLAAAGFAQDALRRVSLDEVQFVEAPSDYLGVSIDPRIVQRLLGLRLLVADLVWIDTLIKSDIRREKQAYTPIYHSFRTVVTLDPDNLMAYYIGGLYLSVVKDDVKGATALLKLGADFMQSHEYNWADAWRLPWMLGYNLMTEEGDIEGGGAWIRKAAAMPGAPPVVVALAKSVETEAGRLEIAERVLNDAYRNATKPEEKKAIEPKMLELGARHELLELNQRFKDFLASTREAAAFSRKRQLDVFLRSIGRTGEKGSHDLLGRQLIINEAGKIAPKGTPSG